MCLSPLASRRKSKCVSCDHHACACAVVIGQPQGRAASREHVRACAMVSTHNRETLYSPSWGRETNKPVKTTAPLCLLYFIDQRPAGSHAMFFLFVLTSPLFGQVYSGYARTYACMVRYFVRVHLWAREERTIEICTRCSSSILQLDGD
jgi:hypothetical protein